MPETTKPGPNCRACKQSYMEPDSGLICGAVNEPFGYTIHKEGEHCDGFKKFEQHPGRNADGTLKNTLPPFEGDPLHDPERRPVSDGVCDVARDALRELHGGGDF